MSVLLRVQRLTYGRIELSQNAGSQQKLFDFWRLAIEYVLSQIVRERSVGTGTPEVVLFQPELTCQMSGD